MSVFSWAIIASKFKKFKRLKQVNTAFLDRFEALESLDEMEDKRQAFQESNLSKGLLHGIQGNGKNGFYRHGRSP